MSQYRTTCLKPVGHHGFTLVELMVTVAIIGIVALIAMPGMQALINNSRISGQAEEMQAALQLARAEAIRRNARVTVCRSTDGATCAAGTDWARWIVHGLDNGAAPPTDDVIRNSIATNGVQISGPANGIVFRSSGLIDAAAAVPLTVCMPVSNPANNQRTITVAISGIVSQAKANGNGVCP